MAHPGGTALPSQAFQPIYGLGASKYLAGGFDFRTQLSLAPKVNFPSLSEQVATGTLIDLNYMLAFKFNNGVFFRETALIGPYLLFGVGGSYVPDHPDAYVPLGGGVRFRVSPRISLQVESVRKLSLNKDYQQMANVIAFVYNMGDAPDYQQLPNQEVEDELVAALLMPKDSDNDGLVDHEDDCPEESGIAALAGCPTRPETDDIAATDPVQLETPPSIELPPLEEPETIAITSWEPVEPVAAQKEEDFQPLPPLLEDTLPEPTAPIVYAEPETEQPTIAQPDPAADVLVTYEPDPTLEDPMAFQPPAEEPEMEPISPPASSNGIPLTALIPEEALTVRPEQRPENSPLPCGQMPEAFESILFSYGSDKLNDDAKDQLRLLGSQLQSCPDLRLVLEGHTDDIGTENDNLVLSVMRAFNVKYFLVYEMGISQSRILSKGKGEQQPMASNDRPQNRRVDFTFVF
ncbi:MAG: OmpA family protein [Bacteroidota bacterium]